MVLARFRPAGRDGDRHHGFGRPVLLQVSRQDRLGLDKPRGFSVIGEAEAVAFLADQPVTLDLGRRQGVRGDARKRRHPHDRPDAGDGPRRTDAPLRRDGRQALPSVARAGRARGAARPRRQERLGRDDIRHGSRMASGDLVPVLRALSEKVSARLKKAGIAGRTVVLKLKTQDFSLAHPQPASRRSDAACRPHFPDRAADAGEGDRRHALPAARHRRSALGRTTAPTRRTWSMRAPPSGRRRNARSTACARNSGARRSALASPSADATAFSARTANSYCCFTQGVALSNSRLLSSPVSE